MMAGELLMQAVRNNAAWCDAVCRVHGGSGDFRADIWVSRTRMPRFYPNAITLVPDLDRGLVSEVRLLEKFDLGPHPGVKDSFCDADLSPLGYTIAFAAEWIARPLTLPEPAGISSPLRWQRIGTAAELAAWEAAWSGDPSLPRVFLPALLDDSDVTVLAAFDGPLIVAGLIAYRSAGVLGISNLFTPEGDGLPTWRSAMDAVTRLCPPLPLVGYESGESLRLAEQAGFAAVGGLRVWLKV